MTDTPLVSIGLPVYNGGRYLATLLDSVLAQTYAKFELIISDNASTDDTLAICDDYATRDPRIVVHRNEVNHGSAWNHRRVCELANGPFFKWCGADDAVDPRFLEAAVGALLRRPDAAIAYPLTIIIDDAGREIDRTTERLPLDSSDVAARFAVTIRAVPVTHCLFYGVYRRSLMSMVRPMGAFLAADRCMLAELALYGPFVRVEEFLMYRRIHAAHRTRSLVEEQRLYVPTDARTFRAREFGVLRESLISIARAPLGPATKLRLLATVVSWVSGERRDLLVESARLLKQSLRRREPVSN